jgi:hypothetical protein
LHLFEGVRHKKRPLNRCWLQWAVGCWLSCRSGPLSISTTSPRPPSLPHVFIIQCKLTTSSPSPDLRHLNQESQYHPPCDTARNAAASTPPCRPTLLDGFAVASSSPAAHLVRCQGTFSQQYLSYKLHNSVKIIDMRRHLGTAVLAGLSLAWTTFGYSNYSSIDMMRAQLSLMDDRPDDCPPWYDTIPPKRENVLIEDSFNCLLPAFTCGQYSECNQYNGKCSCPAGYGGDDCLAPGMDAPIPHLREQMLMGMQCAVL